MLTVGGFAAGRLPNTLHAPQHAAYGYCSAAMLNGQLFLELASVLESASPTVSSGEGVNTRSGTDTSTRQNGKYGWIMACKEAWCSGVQTAVPWPVPRDCSRAWRSPPL
jgi:hypothetical protein